jgi:hypothetical protein
MPHSGGWPFWLKISPTSSERCRCKLPVGLQRHRRSALLRRDPSSASIPRDSAPRVCPFTAGATTVHCRADGLTAVDVLGAREGVRYVSLRRVGGGDCQSDDAHSRSSWPVADGPPRGMVRRIETGPSHRLEDGHGVANLVRPSPSELALARAATSTQIDTTTTRTRRSTAPAVRECQPPILGHAAVRGAMSGLSIR